MPAANKRFGGMSAGGLQTFNCNFLSAVVPAGRSTFDQQSYTQL